MNVCPKCGSGYLKPFGNAGLECQDCHFQLLDTYGRTYEERMAAREHFKSNRVVRGPVHEMTYDNLDDKLERDRTARRLIDQALGEED